MTIKLILSAARILGALTLVACLGSSPHHRGTGVHANLPLRTLGGLQFWGDVQWRAGWRIQEHVWFRHHRLLDPANVRRAWGSREACRAELDERAPGTRGAAPSEHLVILLHGLGRSRYSMKPVATALEAAGLDTVLVAYPSTRAGLEEHAHRLNGLLDEVDGVTRISFVTHSMGGLVAREALAQPAAWRGRMELDRVVQLGPPNQGSQLARWVRPTPIGWLLGPCLATVASDAVRDIPLLSGEFTVLAGGKSDRRGWNPLIDGDDDGVVSVAETWLEGVRDHRVVRSPHTVLMRKEEVVQIVVRLLAADGTAAPSALR